MSQTALGAKKIVAAKAGISLDELLALTARGLKWCWKCRQWKLHSEYCKDKSRSDGLTSTCSVCRRVKVRKVRQKTAGPIRQRRIPGRDGDKKQARRRINYLVEQGVRPHPNTLPCVDCGHIGPSCRHEYDHHRGYEAIYHEDVEVCCARCHRQRAIIRGEWKVGKVYGKPENLNRMD